MKTRSRAEHSGHLIDAPGPLLQHDRSLLFIARCTRNSHFGHELDEHKRCWPRLDRRILSQTWLTIRDIKVAGDSGSGAPRLGNADDVDEASVERPLPKPHHSAS